MIIDDEAPNRENLLGLLQRYCPDITVVAEGGSIETGIMLIQKHCPELLFLDIQLHGRSGFELLKELEQINFEVIFVTAYDQYGIQAVKFSALDYLLKPIDVEELQAAVQKARVKLSRRRTNDRLEYLVSYLKSGKETPPVIALPLQEEIRYIPVGDIIRCEASNTYTHFYLQGGEKILVSQTLKEYDSLLHTHGFLRTHQSHLVNPLYVKSWVREDGGLLLLKDTTKIPISKSHRETVKAGLSGRRLS